MATIKMNNDAYNTYGEQLRTDREQSRLTVAASVLVALLSAMLVLMVVLH